MAPGSEGAGEPVTKRAAEPAAARMPDRDYRRALLLFSIFVVAACGLAYELVAGAVSSYLLGDAVTQFALVIGAFLSAMGLGAFLSKNVRRDLLGAFVELEIAVGLVGGLSSIVMFATNAYLESAFEVVFYGLCVAVGALVGAEIPILIRILQRDGRDLREALGNTLALDYLGALAGSLAFPFVALPYLGLSRVSVVFGLMNLGAAFLARRLLGGSRRGISVRLAGATVILLVALAVSPQLVGFLEDQLYDDDIILAQSSSYQRIVLTRFRGDLRLYLNGHIQFSSIDEARYHEPLVHPVMQAAGRPRSVLVLGGGDGLATREILKFDSVEHVTLVDLDPAVTHLGRDRPELVRMNGGSLRDPRVEIRHEDALRFVTETEARFDVIIADLPDPSSETLAKLYSEQFYDACLRRLSEPGAFVTHATSPFFARRAFWTVVTTLEAAASPDVEGMPARTVHPYHVYVPSFGEWGFVIATREGAPIHAGESTVPTRYLNPGAWDAMFAFGDDILRPEGLSVSTIAEPTVQREYQRGWATY